MELDGIWNLHWNTERVIVFQKVVMQHVCMVSGSRNIFDWIESRLELWNKGVYDELVQDYYRAGVIFLGNNSETQTQEQRHCTFKTFFYARNCVKTLVIFEIRR